METKVHEVSVRVINSYQSHETINAFYNLFNGRPTNVRIVHRFNPMTCGRVIEISAHGKLVCTHEFDRLIDPAVCQLVLSQINTVENHMEQLVLRDVYTFLKIITVEHYTKLLDQVRNDHRESGEFDTRQLINVTPVKEELVLV